MLEEILHTRFMVKAAMKSHRGDEGLTRLLDARQLSLKLIANVTFGYTAANFSGRMACVEVKQTRFYTIYSIYTHYTIYFFFKNVFNKMKLNPDDD